MQNIILVLISSIVGMIIGALWYSPLLFGKIWMKLANTDEKEMEEAKKKGMTKNYIISFVSMFIMSYVLGYFLVDVKNMFMGIIIGLLVWLGFIVTTMIDGVLWQNKSFKLYLLNISHYFVVLVLMSIIFVTF